MLSESICATNGKEIVWIEGKSNSTITDFNGKNIDQNQKIMVMQ